MAGAFKNSSLNAGRATALLNDGHNILLAAEGDGRLCGCLLAYRLQRLDDQPDQLFIYEVGVTPEFQRAGVGRKLLEFARDLVATERLSEGFVVASRTNLAAMKLYHGTGAVIEDGDSVVFVYPGPGLADSESVHDDDAHR